MSTDAEARDLLAKYPAPVRALANDTRRVLSRVLPDAAETVDTSANLIGYGVGPGYKGLVCSMILSKTGVKVGISNGASMDDPASLLEGSGKKHRYVQISSAGVLENPAFHKLLMTALARAES